MSFVRYLAVGLFLLNAFTAALAGSGVAGDLSIAPSVPGDPQVEAANESAAQYSPQQAGDDPNTLFSTITGAVSTVGNFFVIVTVGGPLMINSFLPAWATTFIFAPIYSLVGLRLIYIATGRQP